MRLHRSLTFIILSLVYFLFAGCGSSGSDTPAASTDINIAGAWTITETSKNSNCDLEAPLDNFDLMVTQDGTSSSIGITDSDGNTFTGTLNDHTLTWSGSYPQDAPDGTAGITTLTSMTATIESSCNDLSGNASWTWRSTEGEPYSCSGTTTFSGTREPAIGCGTTTTTTTTSVTHALLNGTWKSNCGITSSVESNDITAVFNNGVGSLTATTYDDNSCSAANIVMTDPGTFTYTLGSNVTVDGSVAGITTATQFDLTDTTAGSPDFGEITYDIAAIKDSTTLYTGDDSGTNDGSTSALRPTQLQDFLYFTKQAP
jgi:hypothetical protein